MIVLLFTSSISTATGFGAVVLALPLCSLAIDVKFVVPLLALTSTVTCIVMTIREYKSIAWRELRRILFWLAVTFPIGNLGYHYLPIKALEIILGLFVTGVAVHGIWRLYHSKPRKEWTTTAGRVILFFGGIIQGALAAGGPLVVTYAQHAIHDRRAFRATLFFVWMTFNFIFTVSSFIGPSRQPYVLLLGLYAMPVLALGMWLGQKLHNRASEKSFQVMVLVILLLSGISLLVPRERNRLQVENHLNRAAAKP